jgi:chemotaxis family two-component system sensor kinase Cph1
MPRTGEQNRPARREPAFIDYMTSIGIPGGSAAAREHRREGAVRISSQISLLGCTPTIEEINALTEWLAMQALDEDRVFLTDRLGELRHPARAFAAVGFGVLMAQVSRETRDFVLWFRPEYTEISGDKPARRLAEFDLHVARLEVVLRRMVDDAREPAPARRRERLLLLELDHRVKSTLSNIQALVLHSGRSAGALAGFTQSLDDRINAIGKTHDLLSDGRWEGVSIDNLVRQELDAYGRDVERITVLGPDVVLTPQAALALSLAIHELGANAAKYGSLSHPDGRVEVEWRVTQAAGVELSWREAGGPHVGPPDEPRFGSNLIERALAMEPGVRSTLKFDRGGVSCDIGMPASSIVARPGIDQG